MTDETQFAQLVDFHCHLDLLPNHVQILKECEELGIHTLTVTNAPSVWPRNSALAKDRKYVQVALGLHPQLAGERAGELVLFEKYLDQARFVGEVGLDGSEGYSPTIDIQRRVFKRILEMCASSGRKILTVHSRRAAREVVETVRRLFPPERGRTILHWFMGTKAEGRAALDAGCYFSVNIKMLGSRRGHDLVAALPTDRILTETDCPFTNVGDTEATPKDVNKAVEALAVLWGTNPLSAKVQVSANLRTLLS